ncbi:Aldo/keto reductase [Lichtheimia hyalospora FSU 10163]|nr:Aldo/keto reductase [Lichtheimia hyalospora FSU 10163]
MLDSNKTRQRLIDGAGDYNEVEVGRGINKVINEGVVKREELFVTTKLWNTYHHKDNVSPAFEKQLKDMGLGYVDLYLIHFPVPLKHVALEAAYPLGWYQPTDCRKSNIGISNFNVQLILVLSTYANIKSAVLQVELHPYLQQSRLFEWVQKQGIQVTAYSSFGPASFIQLTDDGKTAEPLLGHKVITGIASKHGKTPAQVLLRWSIERGVDVIPKSMNVERTRTNIDLFSFSLDKDDLEDIAKLELGLRFNDPFSYGFWSSSLLLNSPIALGSCSRKRV